MKIKVNSRKPLPIGKQDYPYPKGEHIVADSLASDPKFKALFKKDLVNVVPRTASEIAIQAGKDAQAKAQAEKMRKSAQAKKA